MGWEYLAENLKWFSGDEVSLPHSLKQDKARESRLLRVVLLLGIPKGDEFELGIQESSGAGSFQNGDL